MTHETEFTLPGPEPPRIYVASLADYNHGHLHGTWLNAARQPDKIHHDITDMLTRSELPDAEEYAIHDYEGFHHWPIHEHTPISIVAAVARAITQHGPAITAWLTHQGDHSDDTIADFTDAYLGHWPSMHDYAEHLTNETGPTITVEPDTWTNYVHLDTAQLARDLNIELATTPSADGGIYVFDPNIG